MKLVLASALVLLTLLGCGDPAPIVGDSPVAKDTKKSSDLPATASRHSSKAGQ